MLLKNIFFTAIPYSVSGFYGFALFVFVATDPLDRACFDFEGCALTASRNYHE